MPETRDDFWGVMLYSIDVRWGSHERGSTAMNLKLNIFHKIGALIVAIGLIAILVVCLIKYVPTSKRMDPLLYFGMSAEQEEPSFGVEGEKVAAVIVEDHLVSERALIHDGNAYLD